jgi:Rod binding domain-containing protein
MKPTPPVSTPKLDAPPPPDARAQLRHAAHALEGLFLNQLFQAMRETVPEDQGLAAAPGQGMIQSLMDERLADTAAQRMEHGIGEALYRQLARRLPLEVGGDAAKGPASIAAHPGPLGVLDPHAADPALHVRAIDRARDVLSSEPPR